MNRHRATIVLGSVAIIAIAAVCVWMLGVGDPVSRAEAAARAGRWSEVVTQSEIRLRRKPDDLRAARLRVQALAKLGRSDEVRHVYSKVGAELMTAGDFVVLAEVLEQDHREALAWLALEAASRIDRSDARVQTAIAALRPKIGRKGEIAHIVDQLSTIPNGRALGELVVELAMWVDRESTENPIFDRVMSRDRASLKKLDSAKAVQLMFARAMLEAGHSGTALSLLKEMDQASPEVSWLLSRVYLQRNRINDASRALAAAGSFEGKDAYLPEPARYVGAKACKSCHPKEYAAEQSSRHATTVRSGKELRDVLIPDQPVIDPVDPKVVHQFTREGDRIRVDTKVGDETYTAWMTHALGSGHRGVTMIGPDKSGLYRELRISQYSEKGLVWDVTSGFTPHPGDPSEYLGKGVSSAGVRDCLHCHTTRFRSLTNRSGPEVADKGIGCERCHGPGGNHVNAMNAGFPDLAIARFTDATGPERMTACSGCHASDGTFPPTDPQFIRFQSTTLPFSKCYVESKGKLDCVTCHNPHEKLETSTKFYENKCLDCHGPKTSKGVDPFRRVPCPVNAKADCLKCHMPTEPDVVAHTSFTDHHIRVHEQEKVR